MSGLSLPKVSELMTPKERAKLVISLELKGMGEINMNSDDPLPTESEIKQVVAASPSSQTHEYNFHINLHNHVLKRLLVIIEMNQDRLEIIEGRTRLILYLLVTAPIVYDVLQTIKHQPALVRRADYEKALEKAREQKRNDILEIEGRCGLAEREAYEKLLAEGKIEESDDWIDGYRSHIDKYGKTQDQLIDETVAGAKKQLKEYQRRKKLTNHEPLLWQDFAQYENLNDDQIRQLVVKNDSGKNIDISDRLQLPTKEEYELWQKTVIEEKERILKAVKDGKLKARNDGVEAGSYYDWSERYQKSMDELEEGNIEMGMVDGEIVWSGDPRATKSDSQWQHVAMTTPLYENIDITMMGKEREVAISLLESLLPVKVSKEDQKMSIAHIELTNTIVIDGLKRLTEDFVKTVNDIHKYIVVIEEIEQRHFDGMEIVSRDPKHPTGNISRALAEINEIIESHNKKLKEVAHGFNLMGMGLTEYQFDRLDDFLLKDDYNVDDEWVENKLTAIEEEARG